MAIPSVASSHDSTRQLVQCHRRDGDRSDGSAAALAPAAAEPSWEPPARGTWEPPAAELLGIHWCGAAAAPTHELPEGLPTARPPRHLQLRNPRVHRSGRQPCGARGAVPRSRSMLRPVSIVLTAVQPSFSGNRREICVLIFGLRLAGLSGGFRPSTSLSASVCLSLFLQVRAGSSQPAPNSADS